MKTFVLAALVALAPVEAFAVVRYMVQDMTCSEVKASLGRDGAAILYRKTGKAGVPLYDRYVSSQSFCQPGQELVAESVPTADTESCRIPKCLEASRFGDNR